MSTMKPPDPKPPRWAERLLGWYCRPEMLEDLQGDLNEYFERNLTRTGLRRARLIYIWDVLKFFKLYTIRSIKFPNTLIQWIMFSSYVKTSSRNIVRNKLFSAINIIGLAVSMSVGLLMISFYTDLASYDDFFENKDRVYRVVTNDRHTDSPEMDLATTTAVAGRAMQNFTGVESFTVIQRGFNGDAKSGELIIPISGFWATQDFFKVLSFSMLEGDAATALKEPYSIVLTEASAIKLFGRAAAVGKTVLFDTVIYNVTGVIKDIPKNSHFRPEAMVSFATFELQHPTSVDGDVYSWKNIYSTYVYLLLDKNTSPATLQISLDKLNASENKKIKNRTIALTLQPLRKIFIGKHYANEIGPTMHQAVIWIMGGLALVVILSACFNYTNLSVARSLRRSKEVGIRKVIGAMKGNVFSQFIVESLIISTLALVLAIALFLIIRVQFLSLHKFISDMASLSLSPKLLLYFILMAANVGFAAGLIPALFFSKINALKVLKDVSTLTVFKSVNMRKILIVLQYTFSLIFITTTIIGYTQYKSFITFDLGYSTRNILNIKLQGNKSDLLRHEISAVPALHAISTSAIVSSLGSMTGSTMKYINPQDSTTAWLNYVDENYLSVHHHKLLAGRNFNGQAESKDAGEIIVNEQLLKRFNIAGQNPQKALGEVITMDKKKFTIIGVMKDFHYGTVEDKIEAMGLRYVKEEQWGYLNVEIQSDNIPETIAAIETAWQKIDKVHPLDAVFYDDQIEQAYSQFSVMIKVIGFLSFLAICISSMGLFGMVVFTTETRLKEISIRKVLGASEGKLIFLLSRGFILLLLLSALIALPSTFLLFDKIILQNFAYHQPVTLLQLFAGLIAILIIAMVMIGSQTLRVARSNPSDVLKNE